MNQSPKIMELLGATSEVKHGDLGTAIAAFKKENDGASDGDVFTAMQKKFPALSREQFDGVMKGMK